MSDGTADKVEVLPGQKVVPSQHEQDQPALLPFPLRGPVDSDGPMFIERSRSRCEGGLGSFQKLGLERSDLRPW